MKEKAIQQDKLRNTSPIKEEVKQEEQEEEVVKKPTRMSFILPALQNNGFSDIDSDDDNESLKDPNEKQEEKKLDLVDEIEALEISSAPIEKTPEKTIEPVVEKPTVVTEKSLEKPATYEPIPVERPLKPIETPTTPPAEPVAVVEEKVIKEEEKKATMEDIQKEIELTAAVITPTVNTPAATITPTVELNTAEILTVNEEKEDFESMVKQATDLNQVNHLAAILPAVEESIKNVPENKPTIILPEDREREKHSREFEYSIEDPIDLDMFRDNVIAIQAIDPKDIPINTMKPREQEAAGMF